MKRFALGRIEATPAASAALKATNADLMHRLSRHQHGDWGDVDDSRQQLNEAGVKHNLQISSTYTLSDDTKILVITAPDRSRTRVILAEEYQRKEVSVLEGYATWAAYYDQEKNPLIEVEEYHIDAILADLPITRALDVGTGTGRHALKLARRGIAVTGIDQSPDMLKVASQSAHTEGLAIRFLRASLADSLPFTSEQFDFLICGLVLTHVPNLSEVLGKFYRVMSEGSHLLITDFHPDAVLEQGWRTATLSEPGVTYLLPNYPHTRADYLDAITNAGFTLIKVIDAPCRELPEEVFPVFVREFGETLFCLIILAQK
jgi:ubiquinone/menaquinone biosynthesis C-methylase UbiE